jgi:hypothetical protein
VNEYAKITDESLNYDIEYIRKALLPGRLDGPCMFNFCAAGETLLFRDLLPLTLMILKLGHFVSITTNALITPKINEITQIPDHLKSNLFIKCSLHYKELLRLNLIDVFFSNVKKLLNAGISFTVETIANDDEIPYINDIKSLCVKEIGALPHVAESRNEHHLDFPRLTKLSLKKHKSAWGSFNCPQFDLEQDTFEHRIDNYCYAGEYGLFLSIKTGDYAPCNIGPSLGNIYEDIDSPLSFCAVGANCPKVHCYIPYLWSGLCGCFLKSGIKTPFYSEIRDRIMPDGRHWLTPSVLETFSTRLSDSNLPYSEEKAFFINLLMRKVIQKKDPYDHEMADLKIIISRELHKRNIDKISLYGYGVLGEWLYRILSGTDIEISYLLDKRYENLNAPLDIYPPNHPNNDVDAVIIAVIGDNHHIRPTLSVSENCVIIPITDLFKE